MWKQLALGLSVLLISSGNGLWISVDNPDNDFTFADDAEKAQNLTFLMGKAEEFETRLTKHEEISDTLFSKSEVMNLKLESMATTLNDVVDTMENHMLKIEAMERRLISLEGRLEENSSLHANREFNPVQEYIFEPAKYHVEEAEREITEPEVIEEEKVLEDLEGTKGPGVVEEPDVTEVPIVMEEAKFTDEPSVTEKPGEEL